MVEFWTIEAGEFGGSCAARPELAIHATRTFALPSALLAVARTRA
jgi:hypothetical protein